MKKYIYLAIAITFFIQSCGSRSVKPVSDSKTDDVLGANFVPNIVTFDDDCNVGKIFTFPLGASANVHMKIINLNDPRKYYSIGYMSAQSLNITVSMKGINLSGVLEGNYGIELILRNKQKCQEYSKQDASVKCNFEGDKLYKKLIFDISYKVAIAIYNNIGTDINSQELGKGGGIVSDILRGEGFISFIMQFMGNNFLGNNQNQQTQNSNMFESATVQKNTNAGRCANGFLPDDVLSKIN